MTVVRGLISTVNRLTQAGSPDAATKPVPLAGDRDKYGDAGIEPSLDDLIEDPVVQLLMRADGIEPAEIRRLFRAPCQRAPESRIVPATAVRAP